MINFFNFSIEIRVFITFLLGLCILAQTLTMSLNFYRYGLIKNRILESLLEIAILFEIFILAILHGQVINNFRNGFIMESGYENIRVIMFIIVLILVILICIFNRSLSPIYILPATAITLPILEDILGEAYPWFFILALVFLLLRSGKYIIDSIIGIKTSISALSVKNAIDTLNTGVIFSENDGTILLANFQMQKLMLAITGRVFRNSIHFYNMLLSDQYAARYKKAELEDQIVYLLPDETAWIFTKTDILFHRRSYLHVSATNVSEIWALTTQLQAQYQELRNKSQDLKNTIANLHIISKDNEIEKAKIRAHDILGQGLTVLLRTIQNDKHLDYELLLSLSKSLLAELKAEQKKTSPLDEIKNIQKIFSTIGVDIIFTGELPHNNKQVNLIVDIIREGSTNAVRHGFATIININIDETKNGYILTIINNGYNISTPVVLGSGLSLIRKRVQSQGGSFDIIYSPLFTLSVSLLGGDQDA